MSYANIVFEPSDDGVALIAISRPQQLNALNGETMGELDDVLGVLEADASQRAFIVTGAGGKAFVAGADIRELAALDPIASRDLALRGQRIFRRLETMPKPSVAAINGFALGGGLELALSCTMRIASPNAKFGQPEVKLGIVPGYGGTQRLPRMVGRGKAIEMLLTGEPVDAGEALRLGLVNYVVPEEGLIGFARSLLNKILANGPLAVALAMDAVDKGLAGGFEEGLRHEANIFGLAAATGDRTEGMRAFLEKRKAEFKGK